MQGNTRHAATRLVIVGATLTLVAICAGVATGNPCPTAPLTLNQPTANCDGVHLSWAFGGSLDDLSTWWIEYIKPGDTDWTGPAITRQSSADFSWQQLPQGTDLTFRVRLASFSCAPLVSNQEQITGETVPTTPGGVSVANIAGTQVRIEWQVLYSTYNNSVQIVDDHQNLVATTDYYNGICYLTPGCPAASYGVQNLSTTNCASQRVTTGTQPLQPVPCYPADGATHYGSVALMWSAAGCIPVAGYDVEMSSDPGFNSASIAPTTTTTYTWSNPGYGTRYWRVREYNGSVASDWSAPQSFTSVTLSPPPPVTDLLVNFGRTSAAVSWTDVLDGTDGIADHYEIRHSSSIITECNWGSAYVVASGATQPPGAFECVTINNLSACSPHYFAIKTKDNNGMWSDISNLANGSTKCSGSGTPTCLAELLAPTPEVTVDLPSEIELSSANPMRGTGQIQYGIPNASVGASLELAIFDVAGRRMKTLAGGVANSGRFNAQWDLRSEDGGRAGAGVYFLRLRVGSQTLRKTLIVTQ